MKEAKSKIERARKSRLDLLLEANGKECALGCNGKWQRSAGEILQSNNISEHEFEYDDYRTGQLWQDFILKPFTLIFEMFCNPASVSFAWIGVQDKECVFLNDFRWTAALIP